MNYNTSFFLLINTTPKAMAHPAMRAIRNSRDT